MIETVKFNMSSYDEKCAILRKMIRDYPFARYPVIHTFYTLMKSGWWDRQNIISMLNAGKGISQTADAILDEFIQLELQNSNIKS